MICPELWAHVPHHRQNHNRTSDPLVWGSRISWSMHSFVLLLALKVFKTFIYHVYHSGNIPLLIKEAMLFFLLAYYDALRSTLYIVNANGMLMNQSMRNINCGNEESHLTEVTGKKTTRQLKWKAQTWVLSPCGQHANNSHKIVHQWCT